MSDEDLSETIITAFETTRRISSDEANYLRLFVARWRHANCPDLEDQIKVERIIRKLKGGLPEGVRRSECVT